MNKALYLYNSIYINFIIYALNTLNFSKKGGIKMEVKIRTVPTKNNEDLLSKKLKVVKYLNKKAKEKKPKKPKDTKVKNNEEKKEEQETKNINKKTPI